MRQVVCYVVTFGLQAKSHSHWLVFLDAINCNAAMLVVFNSPVKPPNRLSMQEQWQVVSSCCVVLCHERLIDQCCENMEGS
mmetsp:Transcript_20842/g.35556  ORF Transcript_20842/g.35556 Transcript_20842/m.35556 type:complete len:81 (-) Transcript_20842:601-843(-)